MRNLLKCSFIIAMIQLPTLSAPAAQASGIPARVGDVVEVSKNNITVSVHLSKNDILHGTVTSKHKAANIDIQIEPSSKAKIFVNPMDAGKEFTLIASSDGSHNLQVLSDTTATLKLIKKLEAPQSLKRKLGIPNPKAHPLLQAFLEQQQEEDAEDLFWNAVKQQGAPLMSLQGNNRMAVTFLWQGDEDDFSVELLGSKRSFDRAENLLENIEGTNIWFKTVDVSAQTIMTYSYAPNVGHLIDGANVDMYYNGLIASATPDPLNPRVWERTDGGKFGHESVAFGLDAAEHYWSIPREGVPAGTLEEASFYSDILDIERTISIYRPPSKELHANTPVVFIFDGERYSGDAKTPDALNNLIHENKIPPVVAVFVHNTVPSSRGVELPCTVNFTNFLADELLPWVRTKVPNIAKSTEIITAGSSYGGLASSCANLFRPGVFNHVLSQSGSYWWSPADNSPLSDGKKEGWVVRRYAEKGCNGATFYFDAGELEDGIGLDSIGESSEILAHMLREKGCAVTNQRFPGGHDLYHWRETIAHGLIALLQSKVSQ